MDGAALLSVDIAQDKAYTAVSFSMPTHAGFDLDQTIRRCCMASSRRRG